MPPLGNYYAEPYVDNLNAMKRLRALCQPPEIETYSGLPLPKLPFEKLDAVSTGALQDLIRNIAKGVMPNENKDAE